MHKYLIALAALLLLSCKKEKNTAAIDPLVGDWKLRAVTFQGQPTDVSNRDCFKDSYVKVDKTSYTLYLSLPGTSQCESQTASAEWIRKENGQYYVIRNGQEQDAGVKLLDNNETLQMTIDSNDGPYLFSFRK